MIKKYVKGSATNPEGVIKALENLGGINKHNRVGREEKCVYFINIRNVIDIAAIGSIVADLVMECFEEIQPVEPTDPKIITNLDVAKWYFSMVSKGHTVQLSYGGEQGPIYNHLWEYDLDYKETEVLEVRVDFGEWTPIAEAGIK